MEYHKGPELTVPVKYLKPLTRYAIRAAAINVRGTSHFSEVGYIVTGPKPVIVPPPSHPYVVDGSDFPISL